MEVKTADLQKMQARAHGVVIEARKLVRVSGVIEIESFHEDEASIATSDGILGVFGSGLRLVRLNPEEGQVVIDGEIAALEYAPPPEERRGLFSKLRR